MSSPASPTAAVDGAVACPNCSTALTDDARFPLWCPACEWNLTRPTAVPEPRGAWARRRAARRDRRTAARERAVRARVERVYALAQSGAPQHRDAAWLAAAAIAGLVHLGTLTLLLGSLALLSPGLPWPLHVGGVLGLVLAFLLRPRLGRLQADAGVLTRKNAPTLYALADRVAAATGSRPVDSIRVTDEFNASFAKAGLRRRTRVSLGLPLWEPLTPQQQVALLAHEFGHNVNGDHRRGLWLGSALDGLYEWYQLTRPVGSSADYDGVLAVAMVLVHVLLRAVNLAVYGLLVLLDRLTVRAGQATIQ